MLLCTDVGCLLVTMLRLILFLFFFTEHHSFQSIRRCHRRSAFWRSYGCLLTTLPVLLPRLCFPSVVDVHVSSWNSVQVFRLYGCAVLATGNRSTHPLVIFLSSFGPAFFRWQVACHYSQLLDCRELSMVSMRLRFRQACVFCS